MKTLRELALRLRTRISLRYDPKTRRYACWLEQELRHPFVRTVGEPPVTLPRGKGRTAREAMRDLVKHLAGGFILVPVKGTANPIYLFVPVNLTVEEEP
jgi:hypothetical protein